MLRDFRRHLLVHFCLEKGPFEKGLYVQLGLIGQATHRCSELSVMALEHRHNHVQSN